MSSDFLIQVFLASHPQNCFILVRCQTAGAWCMLRNNLTFLSRNGMLKQHAWLSFTWPAVLVVTHTKIMKVVKNYMNLIFPLLSSCNEARHFHYPPLIYLVLSPAASSHLPVRRTGPVLSWSQHWGCSPDAGSSLAWPTAPTSAPLCPSHSLYICAAPAVRQESNRSRHEGDGQRANLTVQFFPNKASAIRRLHHTGWHILTVRACPYSIQKRTRDFWASTRSHLTLSLQIPNLLLLELHVHAELLTFCLQLSDTTSKRISGLHSVEWMRKNVSVEVGNSSGGEDLYAEDTERGTWLRQLKLPLWPQWPPPSSSSSSPRPAVSQPWLEPPAQPSASSPAGI